jgi:hypothetical protein
MVVTLLRRRWSTYSGLGWSVWTGMGGQLTPVLGGQFDRFLQTRGLHISFVGYSLSYSDHIKMLLFSHQTTN